MKQTVYQISTDVSQSVQNIGQLEEVIEKLKASIKDADFGSKEFKELSKEMAKAQSAVKDFEKATEGLEKAQISAAYVGLGENIAGSFGAATGVLALFGTESDVVAKLTEKSQQAITVAMGLRSAAEGAVNLQIVKRSLSEKASAVATYASTTAMAISNAVIGATTGGLKLLRLAVIGTGIGALAIAAIALYQNFDKVTEFAKKIIDKFAILKVATDFIVNAFTSVAQAIGLADTADEKNLKTIEKRNKLNTVLQNDLKNNIDLLKARGASNEEVYDAELKLLKSVMDGVEAEYLAKVKLKKVTEEDKIAFANATKDYNLALETRTKAVKDENQKQIDANKNKYDEQRKQQKEYLSDIKKQLEDSLIDNILDDPTREIAREELELKRKLGSIKGSSQTETELRAQLELESSRKIQKIKDDAAKEEAQKAKDLALKQKEDRDKALADEKDRIQKQYDDQKAGADAKVLLATEQTSEYYEALRDVEQLEYERNLEINQGQKGAIELVEAQHKKNLLDLATAEANGQKDLARAKFEALSKYASQAASGLDALANIASKNGEKQTKLSRALAIASLAINTAQSLGNIILAATQSAVGTGPAAIFTYAGFLAAGIGTLLASFSTAKKILGSSDATPSVTAPSASSVQAPSIMNTDNTPRTEIGPSQYQFKTYVVATDMTQQQLQDKKIEDLSKV